MKKKLLFAALALVCASSVFAYEDGEYAFIKNGRVKMIGQNLVTNGSFNEGNATGWTDATGNAVNAETWAVEPGVGSNGENAIASLGANEGDAFCQVIQLEEAGGYLVSYQIRAAGETTAGATTIGTTPGSNYLDIFLNTTGDMNKVDWTEDAPVASIAAAESFNAEWKTVNYYFEVADSTNAPTFLVIRMEKMLTGAQITNFSVNLVEQVFDIRIAQRKIDWAKKLADLPDFNTADSQAAREELVEEVIPTIEGMMEANALDDITTAEDIIKGLDEKTEAFLDCSSQNLKDQITGIDIASLGYAGRGRTITGLGNATDGGVWLEGGNWGHLVPEEGEEEYLMSAIQSSFANSAKYCIANSTFPAAKYFFTAEIRNANTKRDSWPCPGQTFDLVTTCQISIGETTQDIENVVGEEYLRVYIIAEVTEDGKFTASINWPGTSAGGAFYLRNPEVRTFEMDAEAKAQHVAAWNAFKVQYDAAVSARNTIVSMQSDKNYPWSKQTLQDALDEYDPYLHITDGWITADGEDAGVASTDQLNEWANYQGGEIPEDGKATYYVVRGYQGAINAVKETNKPISNLIAEIANAYSVMSDGMFSDGDKATFMVAITTAQNTLDGILSTTNDGTMEEDAATLEATLQKLTEAIEAYKASSSIAPMVDIDFSNGFEAVINDDGTESYVIKGAAGQMNFTVVQLDNTINDYSFALGVDVNGETQLGDVLHVGGDSYGEVIFPEEVNEGEGLRIMFDFWYGELGKAFQYIDLVNAAGERVAGFSYDSYNSNVEYNEFNNDENTGMDIKGNVKHNHDKSGGPASVCTDALRNSFELSVDYKNNTIQGSFVNSSKQIVGIDLELNQTEGFDNKIVAFRVGGRNHAKANSGAFGRRAWFDNLKIYKFEVPGSAGDVNGDGGVDVADISNVITIMADGTNDKKADVNGDGQVDVADISAIITIMANN